MRAGTLFCLAFFTTAVPAAAFPAHVARCHEGDTCILDSGVRVRLAEIDAPEIDQPYGTEARDVLCAMICGREVDVDPRGSSYDRVVGLIRVGRLYTSEAMVAAGAAWDYAQYDTDPAMPELEQEALQQGRGLWADTHAVPPWDWRHKRPRW